MARQPSAENQPFSCRLDPLSLRFMEALTVSTGLDRSGVVRLAIRDLARQRGIDLPHVDETDAPAPKKKR